MFFVLLGVDVIASSTLQNEDVTEVSRLPISNMDVYDINVYEKLFIEFTQRYIL